MFRIIKRQFGYTKVRFRGLSKNIAQQTTLFALSNLWMARRHFDLLQNKLGVSPPKAAERFVGGAQLISLIGSALQAIFVYSMPVGVHTALSLLLYSEATEDLAVASKLRYSAQGQA